MPSNETNKSGKVFVPPSKISKKYHRTSLTLRRWAEQGKLDHIITPTGRYLYSIHQVEQILGQEGNEERKKYATPDCLQPNRKKTCRGRCRSSETSIHSTSSSKKLVQGSTSKEKDSRSLWTKSVKEWYPKWSSCTRTGCVDLDMISFNTPAKGFTQNCWFTVKRKKMNGSHQKRNLAKSCLSSSTSS